MLSYLLHGAVVFGRVRRFALGGVVMIHDCGLYASILELFAREGAYGR